MTQKEYFDYCRKRLWKLLKQVDFSYGCKSYEGTLEVICSYPSYFESSEEIPIYQDVIIKLYCYVLGPLRKYTFKGKTFTEAIKRFDDWLTEQEEIMEEEKNEDT